mmetsp:Transcript_10324/g.30300  ORF Transcript_10324/g.30300 Transcript_10324/m.30300 type:complete len:238 (-) Transcript_10324:993-1706(-)
MRVLVPHDPRRRPSLAWRPRLVALTLWPRPRCRTPVAAEGRRRLLDVLRGDLLETHRPGLPGGAGGQLRADVRGAGLAVARGRNVQEPVLRHANVRELHPVAGAGQQQAARGVAQQYVPGRAHHAVGRLAGAVGGEARDVDAVHLRGHRQHLKLIGRVPGLAGVHSEGNCAGHGMDLRQALFAQSAQLLQLRRRAARERLRVELQLHLPLKLTDLHKRVRPETPLAPLLDQCLKAEV